MGGWEEMLGDLILDENLTAAASLVIAMPVSIALAALGQQLKKLPAAYLTKERIPSLLTAVGLLGGFVLSYALGLPKTLTMSIGVMAGLMSNQAYDVARPVMDKIGPS